MIRLIIATQMIMKNKISTINKSASKNLERIDCLVRRAKLLFLTKLNIIPIQYVKLPIIKKGKIEFRGWNGVVIFKGEPCKILGKVTITINNISHFSKIEFDANSIIEEGVEFNPRGGLISLGESCFIGTNVTVQSYINSQIIIGKNTLIAKGVGLFGSNHKIQDPSRGYSEEKGENIIIGSNVWIGSNTIITAGVEIGDFSIIGAGSVVTKSIPSFCMAAGNPAKIIKIYDDKKKEWIKQ